MSQIPGGSRLSVEQLNAIDVLVQGRSEQDTAETVGVARETVTRWRNDNPHFTAELNRQRRLIWSDSHDRLRALASKAVDTLETSLDEGDSRVAVEILKAIGLYGQVRPPSGPWSSGPEGTSLGGIVSGKGQEIFERPQGPQELQSRGGLGDRQGSSSALQCFRR